ncbi:hypothetical protein N7478_010636 [Penicillium angulare]|uniref:uncharacterized protein n=1 Tax=Penicillium angulare TaxID=116970 RepID=UPI002541125C|nr:uncharacterized protein N7478_010636 [Penicillium angulare]KAJ5267828.1 hypothetical protein N7478_010636 [Penicillium angulare]
MAPNNDMMAIVDKWFTEQTDLKFKIEFNDVAEYVNIFLSSVNEAKSKEDICLMLDASLLDAPQSVVEKLEKTEDQEQSVKVVILLIENGFPPPARLRRSIFRILSTEQGADLTNHLLELPSAVVDPFRENLTLLLEFM